MGWGNIVNTVKKVVEKNLCISCGACQAACPKSCISYTRINGLYLPQIDESNCIKCGLCETVCPGKGVTYPGCADSFERLLAGEVIECISARTQNEELYNISASGGVITNLIDILLQNGRYDSAFVVDTYNYAEKVFTKEYVKYQNLNNTPKSRYIPIMQTDAFKAMKEFPEKRIILVGTSCFVHAATNFIETFHLNRENYLIVGLFCEKTMNYNVFEYFQFLSGKTNQKKVKELFFRSKEVGGWPGDVLLKYDDDSRSHYSNAERMDVKDYYMPERCMYCLDKLNVFSDISVGDDYTHGFSGEGRSSVIIRSKRGFTAFSEVFGYLNVREQTLEDILKAQKINEKIRNYHYGRVSGNEIEHINLDIAEDSSKYTNDFSILRKKMALGQSGEAEVIYKRNRRNRLERRVKGVIKRILIRNN